MQWWNKIFSFFFFFFSLIRLPATVYCMLREFFQHLLVEQFPSYLWRSVFYIYLKFSREIMVHHRSLRKYFQLLNWLLWQIKTHYWFALPDSVQVHVVIYNFFLFICISDRYLAVGTWILSTLDIGLDIFHFY